MTYSDKERAFYVSRMWSEGLTPGEASKLWGRPCRHSLEAWERAAARGELDAVRVEAPRACEHEKHARYPEDTKAEALRLYAAGRRPSQIARMLGPPSGAVVGAWARAERDAGRSPDPAPLAQLQSSSVQAFPVAFVTSDDFAEGNDGFAATYAALAGRPREDKFMTSL